MRKLFFDHIDSSGVIIDDVGVDLPSLVEVATKLVYLSAKKPNCSTALANLGGSQSSFVLNADPFLRWAQRSMQNLFHDCQSTDSSSQSEKGRAS